MNFQELKNKVDKERERRIEEGVARGESMTIPQGVAPKDSLLHDLQMSLQTGQSSKIVENMRQIDHKANHAKGASGNPPKIGGGGLNDALSQHIGTPPKTHTPQPPKQVINERDAAFDRQIQHSKPQSHGGLSDALGQMGSAMQQSNMNMSPQAMQEAYMQMMQQQQVPQQPQQVSNPSLINEQVNAAINNVDFGALLQESLKNTVLEMYAMEKIQKSLLENKDVIKKIVKETLIELSQAKKKSGK